MGGVGAFFGFGVGNRGVKWMDGWMEIRVGVGGVVGG